MTGARPHIREVYADFVRGRVTWNELMREVDEGLEEYRRQGLASPDPTLAAGNGPGKAEPPTG